MIPEIYANIPQAHYYAWKRMLVIPVSYSSNKAAAASEEAPAGNWSQLTKCIEIMDGSLKLRLYIKTLEMMVYL